MWIRTNDILCKADEFSRFYIDIASGSYHIFGKESDNTSVVLGTYRDYRKAKEAFESLYTALEHGDRAFTMPRSNY